MLILDWPSEAKRKGLRKRKDTEVESGCSTFNKHIILRPSPRAYVLSPRHFPVVFQIYYIDTDEIPGFSLLLKKHIFHIARSEDTIFILHV